MKPIGFPFLAVASLSLALGHAATRPRYGGTLRVEARAALASLNPAQWPADPAQAALEEKLLRLVCDRLVEFDTNGQLRPGLATEWEASADHKTWHFRLRPGVRMHDGTPLTTEVVIGALKELNPSWQPKPLVSGGFDLELAPGIAKPNFLIELASVRNSILRRDKQGALVGTGPFRLVNWDPGRRAILAANEDYWGSRPYLDSVEIAMGRAPRNQLIDLELGRADVVELLPDELRRAASDGAKVWSSEPVELLALLFESGRLGAQAPRASQALALAIDRVALRDVLLQKQGEVAAGLLPQWLSGYAFLFPTAADPQRARQLWSELKPAPLVTLDYDSADPIAQPVAQRVAVDARAAQIPLQVSPRAAGARAADVHLLGLRVDSTDPRTALLELKLPLGIGENLILPNPATPEQLYAAESGLLLSRPLVPLVYLPETYGLGPRVKDWMAPVDLSRGWRLEDVWVEEKAP